MQMPQIERLFAVSRTENPLMGILVKREYSDIQGIQQTINELRQRSSGIPGTRAVFVTQQPLFRRFGQLLGGTNLEIRCEGRRPGHGAAACRHHRAPDAPHAWRQLCALEL